MEEVSDIYKMFVSEGQIAQAVAVILRKVLIERIVTLLFSDEINK
jgi:hypothetical protein